MLEVQLGRDLFALWSIDAARAEEMCPSSLRPVLFENRAWIVFAMVEFIKPRFLKVPLSPMQHAAQMLYVRDGTGACGNFFLHSETNFRPLSWVGSAVGAGSFSYNKSLLLNESEARSGLAQLKLGAPDSDVSRATRLHELFRPSRAGYVLCAGKVFRCPLEKSHWNMDPVQVLHWESDGIKLLDARFEFAFWTSSSRAQWGLPQSSGH
jgi:hypothetical protein